MSDLAFNIVAWIVSLWAVGFAIGVGGCGVILFIDHENGLLAFREWATRRMWRDLAMWFFQPVFVLSLAVAAMLGAVVWSFRVWRVGHRSRRYRTPW